MAISLDSIITGKSKKPPKIIFYAVGGFGKTTFGAQSYSPIFLQTEEGIGNLDYPRFPLATKYDDVKSALSTLIEEGHEYKTIIIDTLDGLEKLVFDKVIEVYNETKKPVLSISEVPFGGGYSSALTYWHEIISLLNQLNNKNIMVICLAHSLIKSFSPPDSDAYDRYRFNLHDKSAELLKDWADIVLFGNYVIRHRKSGQGFNQEVKAIGGDERVVYTEERASHWAKNRYSLPYEIPFRKNESFKTFIDLLYPPKTEKEKTV